MKQVMFFIIYLLFYITVSAQQTDTTIQMSRQDYLQKSRGQKTVGRILLGGGALLYMISVLVATDDIVGVLDGIGNPNPPEDKDNSGLSDVLFITGTVAIVSSIPLFISAGKNKRKAASLSFKTEKYQQLSGEKIVWHRIPSLSLKINL